MSHNPIYLSRDEYSRLRLFLATTHRSGAGNALRNLAEELDRALILDPAAFPADVVTMNSTVEFEDLETNEVEEYTITFPDNADVERKRISILAPIGTALIGCRVGDTVKWSTPGGTRELKVLRVVARASAPSASAPSVAAVLAGA
jgi:regulator of nucleoside diphosphate kinase